MFSGPTNFSRRNTGLLRVLVTVIFCSSLFSCGKKSGPIDADPAFAPYIEAYTSGVISKTGSIRIQLAAGLPTTHSIGQEVKEDFFSFSPSVKGKTVWTDARTIEFRPEENLQANQLYEVEFELGQAAKVPEKFKRFRFTFQTLKPAFSVTEQGLRSSGDKINMTLTGELQTADAEDPASVEKLLVATHNEQTKTISWQHAAGNRSHIFTISNIKRGSIRSALLLKWDGKAIDAKINGQSTLDVPAQGEFSILRVMPVNDVQQYASVQFSDPIAVSQDLTGLLSISNVDEVTYGINGSEVKLFVSQTLEGNYTVNVNPGIQNSWGETLAQPFTSNIVFENNLPSVKMIGHGSILPNSGKLTLPFDAINLNAVDISIIKIYENNVPQFLQENDLNGSSELRRVGKPIVQKTLRLDQDAGLDLHRKQRFSLDIDRFIKTEPGALYRITIGFRPEYSLYSKPPATGDESNTEEEEEGDYDGSSYGADGRDSDDEFWQRYDDYYPYGYNWQRRNDPTHRSYYNKERWAVRNILASNIGLTAKRGSDNSLFVAVTNILSTDPMEGVDVQALDYQMQVIGTSKSDGSGFASFTLKQKPYLLIAKKDKERGYLKINDGSSLPLSRFDVSGEEIKNGIKGFIFGERGVWRPGDSLFLSCLVEDKSASLPDDFPVDFSLVTPQGQLYRHAVQSSASDGFYSFKTATDVNAPTGNWTARVKVGGAVFEKKVKIETVMPNRLKVQLDFGADPLLGVNGNNNGELRSAWLFGSPAKNLKAKIDATLSAKKTGFPQFAGFTFYNPTADYNTRNQTIYDGTLDESGKAILQPDFSSDENAPGLLTANLLVKVFEPGGNFSIDYASMPYSPYSSYAGIKLPAGEKPFDYLLAGKTHSIQLVDVDARGKLITHSNRFEIQYYKIQWRWWWDENEDNLSNFTQDRYNRLLKKDTVTISGGRGNWSFKTGSNEWGRYLILVKDLESGHITGEAFYVDDYGWQSRSVDGDQSAASMLSFTSTKDKYQVGDEIGLTIPSSLGGRVLVSIENGSRVIDKFWQKTEAGQTKVSFKATADMAPNVYATVSLLQPHAQTLNDLPIRMYGSIPLLVENPKTHLKPVLNMPDVIKPEQQVSLTVSEADGRDMTYCVAMVDEGLLDLTHFKTPDPHAAFYAREALGVKSFDLFDQVIGAWGGDLERILSIGGDADAAGSKQKTANRFKPVVKFIGPFKLGKGKKQEHRFQMPAYIGSVRTMLIAAKDGSYGATDKTVAVKKPLMILSTVPRVLAPGETITIPVTVFAMEKNVRNVTVNLQPNALFDVVGPASQPVVFSEPGEQVVYFNLRTRLTVGIGKINVTATSGAEKANDATELDIRNPNPVITQSQAITLGGGQSWSGNAVPVGLADKSTGLLEISSIPPMNLQKRLSYLITYPHGCIEQTTSSVFPQLVLKQLTDLTDAQKAEIDRNIRSAMSRLNGFQCRDGGFAYWPGLAESDEWGSNYAGHFLIEAQNNGFMVPDLLMNNWRSFQRNKANQWVPSTTNFYGGDLTQAYRLFTLALAKAPEVGAMNRLKEFKYLSPEAKWRLAAAYKLIGQDNTAFDLVAGLPTSFSPRPNPGSTFGSDLRDQAMVLEVLTIMGNRNKAAALVSTVAGRLSEESWYSTQTTAYALMAIAKYCGKNPSGTKIMATVSINGQAVSVQSGTYLRQIPIPYSGNNNPVSIRNQGSNQLYVRLVSTGQPLTGDSSKPVNNPALLNMTVNYLTQNGQTLDASRLTQGTDFIAKVTVTNTGKQGTYTQMALTQAFPSGWEILNTRLMDAENAFKSSGLTYQDVRDDRVHTYFNLKEGETVVYFIQLNATYPGRYYLPATRTEAMYDNRISAASAGRWVEVLNQP